MLYCKLKQHRLSKPLVVEHGEIARRAPPNNFFLHAATTVSCILQFAACSSHGRKIVDLYIYEQFGQLLVTVGQFANQIAEFSLLKMLRSRCFASIVKRPISRSSPLLHESRPDFTTQSLAPVRAANSNFPLVPVTSKSCCEPNNARALPLQPAPFSHRGVYLHSRRMSYPR